MEIQVGDEEAALSDFEDDDLEAAPVVLAAAAPPSTNSSNSDNALSAAEASLKAALADLDIERQARKAAEAAKADSDSSVVRLKAYIHEVIKKRDEALKHKDEVSRIKEERSKQLEEALLAKEDVIRQKEEISLQKDEILRQKEEISRARDSARTEIEGVARILVTQAEKVTSMISGIKSFPGGLPRVPKSTGLAAIALGFAKRVEEVVDEVLRQREDALKRRNELHIQMEQRNFSIAIEVSQLEASITQLKEEVGKKTLELERWQKLAAGKDGRIAEIEQTMLEQLGKTKQDADMLKERVEEVEGTLQHLNSEIAQNTECTAKVNAHLQEILRLMRKSGKPFQPDLVVDGSPLEESSAGQELVDLAGRVVQVCKENQQRVERERKEWESTVRKVLEEKSDILLKLSFPNNGIISPPESQLGLSSDTEGLPALRTELQTRTTDHNLEEESIFSNQEDDGDVCVEDNAEIYKIIGEARLQTSLKLLQAELAAHEMRNNQTSLKISILEEGVKSLQQELDKTTSTSRIEIDRLQVLTAAQAKEILDKKAQILHLDKHIESVTGELLSAEEEVSRWKEAATAEADAGAAILEEVETRNAEIAALNERLAEVREILEETNSKISSKEEMAMAAIAARNAAERSLQMADERATDLRHRMEEMSRQLEEFEQRGDYIGSGLLDMCWPWLRGRGRPHFNRSVQDGQGAAEMSELLEPLV